MTNNIFYSPSTLGFFNSKIHGNNMPEDVVLVPYDDYLNIIQGQSSGLYISAGENGLPVLKSYDEITSSAPINVTRAQGKAALIRAGLWQGVVDFVNSISDPVEKAVAEVALNDTAHWQRSSPFLNSAAQALGLTDEQLNQLFIDASKIEL